MSKSIGATGGVGLRPAMSPVLATFRKMPPRMAAWQAGRPTPPLISLPRLPGADRIARFGLRGPRPLRLALIVLLFPSCQRQLALDPSALEIDLGRNQRQSLLPRLALQLLDLAAMQQQLPISHWSVIGPVPVRVLADMRVQQPGLVALD